MTETIRMEWMNWPDTRSLVEALDQSDVQFRFVGGCVRDALLGLPAGDIDIATSAMPEAVQNNLRSHGIKTFPTGIAHGTITALLGDKHFEITTLRKDVTTDGRHAVVAFTDDWKLDAERRDFTMNALYADTQGNITDYFDGISDAKAGVVKFIGDATLRITEDALRILRFFRFSARYAKGALDATGLAACEKKRSLIDGLSGERIQMEMLKLLTAKRAADMLDAMQKASILPHVIPATVKPELLSALGAKDGILALALLLRSSSEKGPAYDAIASRWKLSNAQKKTLQHLLTPISTSLDEAQAKAYIRRMGGELFTAHLQLSATEEKLPTAKIEPLITLAKSWQPPEFPVSGDDLIKAGFKAGVALGELLSKLETKWEESGYSLSKEALLKQL